MKLRVLAPGGRMPVWVRDGVAEYTTRMPRECPVVLEELRPGNRRGGNDPAKAMAEEGRRMLSALGGDDRVIALDVRGSRWSTEKLARRMDDWLLEGRDVSFLIGGPDGLDPQCLARADHRVSLSDLTLPHGLVRVILAEQLYRAWSILTNHPYHRSG